MGEHSIEHWDGQSWTLSWRPHVGYLAFAALTAAGSSAAWVVGERYTGSSANYPHQWIASWDGSQWHANHVPTFRGASWLNGVVAVSADDVWAVGARWVGPRHPYGIQSLIEHWDGHSWKVTAGAKVGHPALVVPAPKRSWTDGQTIPRSGDQLNAIAAIAADDIWAVGEADFLRNQHKPKNAGIYDPRLLSEHWNGKKWTVGPTLLLRRYAFRGPPYHGETVFDALAAAPPGDVLALGDHEPRQLLSRQVWRLSGSTWRPDLSWTPMYLTSAITITSHDDAWVMGWGHESKDLASAHWDGRQWLRTDLPAQGVIEATAATAPDDLWVAGKLWPPTGTSSSPNEMLHYTC